MIREPNSTDQEPSSPEPARPLPARVGLRERVRAFPVTYGFLIVTALVFLGQLAGEALVGFDVLLALGAKSRTGFIQGEYWRALTPIFLHVGLLHFGVNMYSLHLIGPGVEQPYGRARFLLLYLLSGVMGTVFSLALAPYPSVGASGSIFGLLGALAAFLYSHRKMLGRAGVAQLRQVVFIALLNLAIGLSPGIDNWGHLGGLLTGAGLGLLLGPRFSRSVGLEGYYEIRDTRGWGEVRGLALASALAVALLTIWIIGNPSLWR